MEDAIWGGLAGSSYWIVQVLYRHHLPVELPAAFVIWEEMEELVVSDWKLTVLRGLGLEKLTGWFRVIS